MGLLHTVENMTCFLLEQMREEYNVCNPSRWCRSASGGGTAINSGGANSGDQGGNGGANTGGGGGAGSQTGPGRGGSGGRGIVIVRYPT